MELVVDSNRIIAALIKDSVSRKIILNQKFSLYSIEFGVKEVRKYREEIKRKAKINSQEFNFVMKSLLSRIYVFSEKEISVKSIKKAVGLIGKIDPNDVPFIALSLELGKMPIWSDDKHFRKQREIRVLTTKHLSKKL